MAPVELQAIEEPPQLSPKTMTGTVTLEEQFPALLLTDMFEGQVMFGFWLSLTVTVKLQEAVLGIGAPSATVTVTVVNPMLKTAPLRVEGIVAVVAPERT